MNRQIVAIEIQAIKGCISHDPLRAGAKLRSTLERGNDQRARSPAAGELSGIAVSAAPC
jgi:hypothetical protein